MKIEMDMITGMIVVESFGDDTDVVTGSLRLKDFLTDTFDRRLGFEATEEEAQEVLGMGYAISGYEKIAVGTEEE